MSIVNLIFLIKVCLILVLSGWCLLKNLSKIVSYLHINLVYARTMAFSTLMMFQIFNVLNVKTTHTAFKGLFKNKWLWLAIIISILLQLAVIYTPLNIYFKTVPLMAIHWLYVVGIASIVLWFGEVMKLARKWN